MGVAKEQFYRYSGRGYHDSDKWICANQFQDRYIKNYIYKNGCSHTCDFCKSKTGGKLKHKCVPLTDVLGLIMNYINEQYPEAEGNAVYDSENNEYLEADHLYYPEEIINSLEEELGCGQEVLYELNKCVNNDLRISRDYMNGSHQSENRSAWENYCQLVKDTKLRPEQIIYEMDSPDKQETIERIESYLLTAKEFIEDLTHAYVLNKDTPIYRAVTYIGKDYCEKYKCSRVSASMVGTPLPAFGPDLGNRMSDKGEMVFYGTSEETVCRKEVEEIPGHYYIIGKFHVNKRTWLMDLSVLYGFNRPSILDRDPEQIKKRDRWDFLKQFMTYISQPVDAEDENAYKPTQVFAKYIQRKTRFSGIAYPSSHFDPYQSQSGTIRGRVCFAIFVDAEHCIDKGRIVKDDKGRIIRDESLKLVMEPNPKMEFIDDIPVLQSS